MRRTLTLVLILPLVLLAASGPDSLSRPQDHTVGTVVAGVGREPVAPSGSPASEPAAATTPTEPEATDESDPIEGAPDAEGTVAPEERHPTAEGDPGGRDATPADGGSIEDRLLIATVPEFGAVAGVGPRWRYTIEVEPGLGIDVEDLAVQVRAALTDERSWARTRTLEQVDDPDRARIRIVLASPETVDDLCGRAGLRTAGIYSCWNGRFAALNSWRWEVGADAFDDITTYRNYLVNHEFGHGLGYGHVGCPAPDAPAPVMMQQSKGVGDCRPNGWPYP